MSRASAHHVEADDDERRRRGLGRDHAGQRREPHGQRGTARPSPRRPARCVRPPSRRRRSRCRSCCCCCWRARRTRRRANPPAGRDWRRGSWPSGVEEAALPPTPMIVPIVSKKSLSMIENVTRMAVSSPSFAMSPKSSRPKVERSGSLHERGGQLGRARRGEALPARQSTVEDDRDDGGITMPSEQRAPHPAGHQPRRQHEADQEHRDRQAAGTARARPATARRRA